MSFDESEFDTGEEVEVAQRAAGDDIIASLAPQQPAASPEFEYQEDDLPEDYMSQVDLRLEIAQYYRALLSAPLFDKDTPAARLVVREHHRFIKERLEILLGIQQEQALRVEVQAAPLFAPEEVAGIKILIGQMRAKGMIAASAPSETPPPAAPKPAPAASPVVAARAAPARAPAPPVVTPAASPPTTVVTSAPPAAKARQGRKPGPKPLAEVRTVVNPETGQEVQVTATRIQRPAGAIPFPTDMGTATHRSALTQSGSGGIIGVGGDIGGKPLSAVIAAAVKL